MNRYSAPTRSYTHILAIVTAIVLLAVASSFTLATSAFAQDPEPTKVPTASPTPGEEPMKTPTPAATAIEATDTPQPTNTPGPRQQDPAATTPLATIGAPPLLVVLPETGAVTDEQPVVRPVDILLAGVLTVLGLLLVRAGLNLRRRQSI